MDRLLILASTGVLGFAFWFSGDALADEDEFDRTPVNCILVNRIRRTEVIDDQSILFFMRGNQIYRAMLPYTCLGLEREQRFAYEVRGGRLCNNDTITVIDRTSFGSTGMTCPIGLFHPTTLEAVQELRGVPQQQQEMVPVERAEQPGDADVAQEDGD
jgi:hypothetical protein